MRHREECELCVSAMELCSDRERAPRCAHVFEENGSAEEERGILANRFPALAAPPVRPFLLTAPAPDTAMPTVPPPGPTSWPPTRSNGSAHPGSRPYCPEKQARREHAEPAPGRGATRSCAPAPRGPIRAETTARKARTDLPSYRPVAFHADARCNSSIRRPSSSRRWRQTPPDHDPSRTVSSASTRAR